MVGPWSFCGRCNCISTIDLKVKAVYVLALPLPPNKHLFQLPFLHPCIQHYDKTASLKYLRKKAQLFKMLVKRNPCFVANETQIVKLILSEAPC